MQLHNLLGHACRAPVEAPPSLKADGARYRLLARSNGSGRRARRLLGTTRWCAADGLFAAVRDEKEPCWRSTICHVCSTSWRGGLVSRERPMTRGHWWSLPKGRVTQARTWKVYARAIQKHVGERLDDKAAVALGELLGRLTA